MESDFVTGVEFAATLATDSAHERFGHPGPPLVVVDDDGAPARMDTTSVDRLATLPTVVVAVTDAPGRPPGWADLAVGRGGPGTAVLEEVTRSVTANPLAATTLALLLRGGGTRTLSEGLVAESTAYGLLQGGAEFAHWRSGRPARIPVSPSGPAVRLRRLGDVLDITLDRPHRHNALDAALRDGLVESLQVAVADPSVTTVRLSGAGPSFCSGGDLDEFGSRSDPASAHLLRMARSPARLLAEVADRTEVRIHGDTVGSGIELAAFAHRVVADPGTRISLPEVHLGLIPGAGGTVSLPRRIGRHRTLLLALGVDVIDAGTALGWGLVDALA